MAPRLVIRRMEHCDLPAAIRVHQKAFDGFFLTRMGPTFLRGYYASILAFDRSLALVAEQDGAGVVGVAAGFRDPDDFYAHLKKRRFRLIPVILAAMVRRPTLIAPILRNARRIVHADGHGDGTKTAELASIGVSVRGGGIGTALVAEFCRCMFEVGVDRVTLTTDEGDNQMVRSFYERQGFVLSGHERRGARTLCVYTLGRGDVRPSRVQAPPGSSSTD